MNFLYYKLVTLSSCDVPICRCNSVNKALQESVKCNLIEINALEAEVTLLKQDLVKLGCVQEKERQMHEESVRMLREDLRVTTNKLKIQNTELERESWKREAELKENHDREMKERQREYQGILQDMQMKYREEVEDVS